MIELNERRLTTDLLDDRSGRGVLRFLDPPDFFTEEEKGDLLMLLPLCYRLVGDLKLTAQAMEEVLQVKIGLEQRIVARSLEQRPVDPGAADGIERLSGMQLGVGQPVERNGRGVRAGAGGLAGSHGRAIGEHLRARPGRAEKAGFPSGTPDTGADQFATVELRVRPAPAGARLATERGYCRLGVTSILN